jgi:uncharacterized protein YjbJ (UPF0337 family)
LFATSVVKSNPLIRTGLSRNQKGRERKMDKLSDQLAGKTKQIVAEVTGDGKLAEEGKEQVKKGEKEPIKPLGNLDKLT